MYFNYEEKPCLLSSNHVGIKLRIQMHRAKLSNSANCLIQVKNYMKGQMVWDDFAKNFSTWVLADPWLTLSRTNWSIGWQ